MAESNKQASPTAKTKSPLPSRTRSVTPGSNAFSRRYVQHQGVSTPSSVQGRPFLTSPYLYSKSPMSTSSPSDTYPSPATARAFQSDPAALWRKIAEQKKYLDEQLAGPLADENLDHDNVTAPDQVTYPKLEPIHQERPKTPEDKIDLLASPNPDVTPTHRMGLEREREEKLLKLIRSGGATSPGTRIANIHHSRGMSSAKPDLNKPVPPEPGSPKKRFFEKFGLGLGGTPPLKPAEPEKSANADPVKTISTPLSVNVASKVAKVLGTRVGEAGKKNSVDKEDLAKGHEQSNTNLTAEWPLAGHKTVASAQFFHNDFPLTPSIVKEKERETPSPPKSASTDTRSKGSMLPIPLDGGGVMLDPGVARTYTRVSPVLSGAHSMSGVVENAASIPVNRSPASHTAESGAGPSTAGYQQMHPRNSVSPVTPLTNYDGYSPSLHVSHGSWYPPPGHPYAPASLYPTPLNIPQHYAYHPGYLVEHAQGSPMTIPPYQSPGSTSGHPMHPSNNASDGAISTSLPETLVERLEPQFKNLEAAMANLMQNNEAQFLALRNSASENNVQIMKAIEKMNSTQEQVAAITSKLIEFMESCRAQNSPSQKLYALQPVNPPQSGTSDRSRASYGHGGSAEYALALTETLPSTAYAPAASHKRKESPNRDKIERGPNEQAYFKELGMHSGQDPHGKAVHPAYRTYRNTQ